MSIEPIRSIPDSVPDENKTLGWAILEWTANYLLQPDGPEAEQPWAFTDEQARIILRFYEIDENGRFIYRRGVLRRMKGHGKDPFLAALAAAELCGPCRFGGWLKNGEPIVKQHPAPWIQVAAVTLEQTRNTMLLFPGMLSPEAIKEYKIDLGKEKIYARGTGQIQAVTSSARALEGNRATFVIANESHLWLANNEGLSMAEVIKRNLAKARDGEARAMEITNAHLPGEESAAEQTYEAWRAGTLKGVYYDSMEAPAVADITDREAVREALLVCRGDSTWLDVDRLLDEIGDPTTPEWESRRYYLNEVVAAGAERWIPAEFWAKCTEERKIPDHEQVTLGFDGSFNFDATALVVVQIGEKPHLDVVKLWERKDTDPPDWEVPIEEVEDAIRVACKKWRVKSIACDSYRWARSLQILEKERLPVEDFPQSAQRMIPATTRFHEAVMNGQMTHSGDKDLARHVENAVLKVDSRGGRLSKDSKHSPRRIDLAVAAVMAFDRAASFKKRSPRVISLADALANSSAT